MKTIYRAAIGVFMVLMGVIFFFTNFFLKSSESVPSPTSNGTYLILAILIASLVVVVVPGIFVFIRLTRR